MSDRIGLNRRRQAEAFQCRAGNGPDACDFYSGEFLTKIRSKQSSEILRGAAACERHPGDFPGVEGVGQFRGQRGNGARFVDRDVLNVRRSIAFEAFPNDRPGDVGAEQQEPFTRHRILRRKRIGQRLGYHTFRAKVYLQKQLLCDDPEP